MSSVFSHFLENDLKVEKILGLTFFKVKKDLEGFRTAFLHLFKLSLVLDGLITTPVYSRRRGLFLNSAFPNKKNLAQKSKFIYLWQANLKANVCKISTFQVNRKNNATKRWRLTSSNRPSIMWARHAKNDKTNPSDYKLGESTVKNKALLFFLGNETFKLLTVLFKPLRYCLRSDKLVNYHVWNFCEDLFAKFRVFLSVNQIAPFNDFLSDFVEITSCVCTKTIIIGFRNVYLNSATIHFDFKE